jgi:hypothetical protein
MTLLYDSFADNLPNLTGWVITSYSRYDPTHIDGLTPSGKVFTVDMVGSTITLAIAGNRHTITRAKALWEDGALTIQAIKDAFALFPAAQR